MATKERIEKLQNQNIKEYALYIREASTTSIATVFQVALVDDQYLDEELIEMFGDHNLIETIRILGVALEDAQMYEIEDVAAIYTEDEWF